MIELPTGKFSFDGDLSPRSDIGVARAQPRTETMTRILLIEDDDETAHEIVAEMVDRGFHIERAATGSLGLETVASFTSIPPALADRFLFRHIHPHVPEGKTLIQLLDPWRAAGP